MALWAGLFSASAWAAAICQPGVVRRDGAVIPVAWHGGPASVRVAASPSGDVRLRYVAHSSFLITAPDGSRALTDPYYGHAVRPTPDAVTVSNMHETHSATSPYEKRAPIFFGTTAEGRPNPVDRVIRGLRIFAFPQVTEESATSFVINTIFVIKAGGLCFAHFGNSRFGPSLAQIRALGKIHVMMVPIDGSYTVPHEIAAKLTKRIGPNIVIPMHYFGPELPTQFAVALRAEGFDRVVHAKSTEVTLSLRRLPAPTVFMVMPSDEIP